jgi:dTDP-4-dehydrorhamnose reductase
MENTTNNICVLGSNGMLGYAVSEYFDGTGKTVLKLSRNEYDIAADPISVLEEYIKKFNVGTVINCAGVIKPRIISMAIEDVLTVNSIFPHNLAKVCERENIKCIHITTDCVYTGNKGNYSETDLFDADDIYGMTKNAGEPSNCMVLRTSIIGEEKNNESRSLLEWVISQKGNPVNGYSHHLWNGVTTIHLAYIIKQILDKQLFKHGLYHIHSPNRVNKYELLRIINKHYSLDLSVAKVEPGASVKRDLTSIHSLINSLNILTIDEQIKEMYDFFKA